jgi:malate dehydrogenase
LNISRNTTVLSFEIMINTIKPLKISVIGAGNVGALTAMRILEAGMGNIVLLDIAANIAKGKAEDLMDAASLIGHGHDIMGTDDYRYTKESDIIVITAGFARKPGMTREELLNKNASVVKDVTDNFMKYNQNPIVIVVTNPLDVMTGLVQKQSGLKSARVFGMAGCLDASRMNLMSARCLGRTVSGIDSMVMGTHGETMVPVISKSRIDNNTLESTCGKDAISRIIEKTKQRGAEIVSYLGSGSAYYAPSAGVFRMVKAVINDTQEILPCSCMLSGEYGINDVYLGVPAQIGRDGVEDIIEFTLSDEEKKAVELAAESVRGQISQLKLN